MTAKELLAQVLHISDYTFLENCTLEGILYHLSAYNMQNCNYCCINIAIYLYI